jgi:rhodanese-related sulfurtransferase
MTRKAERRVNMLALAGAVALALSLYALNARHVDAVGAYDASARFNVREVDTTQARTLIDAGAIVIDVRSREAFADGHIAGALNIPVMQLRTALPEDPSLDRTQPIIIYSAEAGPGAEGTAIMNDAGFSGAVTLRGGVDAWSRAGLPTEKPEA